MTTRTLGELAEWVMENRGKHAFVGETFTNVLTQLQRHASQHTMSYVQDDSTHDFLGLITYAIDHENRILFIQNLIVKRYCALQLFARFYVSNYMGYSICANRRNEHVHYDTQRLINHIMKGEF